MSSSLYEASIPLYQRGLSGLRVILARARTHSGDGSPDELLNSGIADRLNTLAGQVASACNRASADVRRVLGVATVRPKKSPRTFAELDTLIAQTVAFLDSVDAEILDAAASNQITIGSAEKGNARTIGSTEYVLLNSIPQFYFHLTTVYVILRYNGIPLRKPDFLGSGPQT